MLITRQTYDDLLPPKPDHSPELHWVCKCGCAWATIPGEVESAIDRWSGPNFLQLSWQWNGRCPKCMKGQQQKTGLNHITVDFYSNGPKVTLWKGRYGTGLPAHPPMRREWPWSRLWARHRRRTGEMVRELLSGEKAPAEIIAEVGGGAECRQ